MLNSAAWLNGKRIPFAQMALPVWDLGVVAGAGVSEMARTFAHKPFRLTEHVRRLHDSCTALGFDQPYEAGELCKIAEDLLKENCRLLSPNEDLGIVIFVTAGGNPTYLGDAAIPGPSVGIHMFRLPFRLWQTAAAEGVRLTIPRRLQISEESLPIQRKVRNRLHWWLADREAGEIEPGSRALLLDGQGRLTETSTSAFYGVIDGTIVSPRSGVLDSMSRRLVEEAAAAKGLAFQLTDLFPADIPRMSQAFVSSTPFGVLPVRSVNGQCLSGGPEPLLGKLLSWWEQNTGVNPQQQILEWRTAGEPNG